MARLEDDPNDPAKKFFEIVATPEDTKLGMRYVKTEIIHVNAGGFAERNGVEVDDEIWEIDGVSFDSMTEKDKFTIFTTKRPITIKLKRPKYKDTYYELRCDAAKLGLKYNKTTITTIVPGGWAAQNGVLRGDKLIEVNGELFEKLDEQRIYDILRGKRPLIMQFKRPASVHIDQAALAESEAKVEASRDLNDITNGAKKEVKKQEKYGPHDMAWQKTGIQPTEIKPIAEIQAWQKAQKKTGTERTEIQPFAKWNGATQWSLRIENAKTGDDESGDDDEDHGDDWDADEEIAYAQEIAMHGDFRI